MHRFPLRNEFVTVNKKRNSPISQLDDERFVYISLPSSLYLPLLLAVWQDWQKY
jgi:hypothetical protein